MESLWKVIREDKPIAGDTIYRVYRVIDTSLPDKIGNREYREGLFREKRNAEFFAQKLNGQIWKPHLGAILER